MSLTIQASPRLLTMIPAHRGKLTTNVGRLQMCLSPMSRGEAGEDGNVALIGGDRAGALKRQDVRAFQSLLKREIVQFGRRSGVVVPKQPIGRLHVLGGDRAPAWISRCLKGVDAP